VTDAQVRARAEDVARLAAWNDTAHPYPDDVTVHADEETLQKALDPWSMTEPQA
jgi:hypothetical protein